MDYFSGQLFPVCGEVPRCHGMWMNHPNYYGIQYNHSGKLRLEIDGELRGEVAGPHLFITRPGRVYNYGCAENERRHHCFICTIGERVESYIAGGLFEPDHPQQPLAIGEPERFFRTFSEIVSLVHSHALVPPRAVLLFEDLLLQIMENRTIREPLPPYCGESIKDLVERIRNAPEGDFDIDVEAARCHITTAHFRRLFKRQMGVPPRQFIIYCRLEKAAAMLLRGHSSVAEVALCSGFADQNYFARMFKQQYRITPLDYRRTFQ